MTIYCEKCEYPAQHQYTVDGKTICEFCYCEANGHDFQMLEPRNGWEMWRVPVTCTCCGEDAPAELAEEIREEYMHDLRDEADLNAEYLRDQMEALR